MPEGAFCILVSKFCFRSLSHCSLFINCSYRKSFIAFSSRHTFISFITFHLSFIFHFFESVLLPLAHTYFIFFLFSHVFPYLWHMPISSFFAFRMYSLASGTYLFLLFSLFACIPLPLAHAYFLFFLFSHVFPYLWHIPNP